MDIKIRMRLLRQKIKGVAMERKELLDEQREYKIELNELKKQVLREEFAM